MPIGSFAGQFTGWRGPFWALAGLVLWLCSDAASFTTGNALVVDGGQTV